MNIVMPHPGNAKRINVDIRAIQQRLNYRESQKRVFASSPSINLGVPKLPVGHLERINPYRQKAAELKKGFWGFYTRQVHKAAGIPKANPYFLHSSIMMSIYLDAVNLAGQYLPVPLTTGRQKAFRPMALSLLGAFGLLPSLTKTIVVKKNAGEKTFTVDVPMMVVDALAIHAGMQLFTSYGDQVQLAKKNGVQPPELPALGLPPDDDAFKSRKPGKETTPTDGDLTDDEDEGDSNGDDDYDASPEDGLDAPSSSGDSPSGITLDAPTGNPLSFLTGLRIPVSKLARFANRNMPLRVLEEMTQFVEYIYFKPRGASHIMMLHLTLNEAVAQAMTCSQFSEIRPYDVHAFIRNWVSSLYGLRFKNAPALYVAPLHKIRESLPEGEDLRINEDGIAIDPTGRFYVIPRKVDSIPAYESQLNAFLRNDDGSYSEEAPDGTIKLYPPSMEVFVDWVNKKFSYTDTTGKLQVLNMDRFQPAKVRHYAGLFKSRALKISGQVSTLINFIKALLPSSPELNKVNFDSFLKDGVFYIMQETEKAVSPGAVTFGELLTAKYNGLLTPSAYALIEACKMLVSKLDADSSLAYSKYSVVVSAQMKALAKIIATHAEALDNLYAVDRKSREKYENQSLDPNYTPEALPYVKDDAKAPMSVLPHQLKVLNAMRESPDFALWGVAAGGGKTPLSVLNYLKEMKEGHCKRVLVLAPNRLVSTHVREITTFTSGRMNIIPITTYTFRRQGLARLQEMIDSAPINTVVVVSMNVLDRATRISYGSLVTDVFYIAEWLRQFNWDYCVIDEIHMLRNPSKRQSGVHRLISGIKKIRGMSGTLVANQLQDLAPQIALLDPTLFGSQEDFKKTYAEEFTGAKVLKWKPGAKAEILSKIKENIVFTQVNRKEWAARLPTVRETFYAVNLTPTQQQVYMAILQEAREEIEKDPILQAKLKKYLDKKAKEEEEDKLADSETMSESLSAIQSLLRPYLQRLERFVTAPHREPAGANLLEGVDQISPKLIKVGQICVRHAREKIPGKVLIFTNYDWSGEECAEYLNSLPELRGRVLHYKPAESEALQARFEKDPNALILCGVGQSLSTGLNLQFASRLIRLETVWTPGEYEQGNARINRPNIQTVETRSEVYVDTVVAEGTIDITKASYLMSKIITAEKFYNMEDPRYADLPEPPLFKMSIDTILNMNSTIILKEYIDAFNEYQVLRDQDYAEFKVSHPDMSFTKIERAGNLVGSQLMRRTPYEPGTQLYSAKDLGLVRYDEFMGQQVDESEEDEDEEVESLETRENSRLETQKVRGLAVHTDEGDGEIVSAGKMRVRVRLYSTDEVISRNKLAVFVITRASTNSKDMRVLLAKKNPDIPLQEGEEPQVPVREKKVPKEKPTKERQVVFDLGFVVVNGMLGVVLNNAEEQDAASASRQFGFNNPPSFMYARLWNRKQFAALAHVWREGGMKMPYENSVELKAMYDHMQKFGTRGVDLFDLARKNDFRLFLRMSFKPEGRTDFIKPFPYIFDDKYHVALPWAGQAGSKVAGKLSLKISKLGAKSLQWRRVETDTIMYKFVLNKAEASALIKEILASGIIIGNLKELAEEFRELRFRKDSTRR